MDLDYKTIGKRIAKRRKELGLKQATVEEMAELGAKYLSSIETGKSIPSTEVIMRLALALDTTPDEFLVGTARDTGTRWREVAELLRDMDDKQLTLAGSLLTWLRQQAL
ncbi:helix-turn-helix domain-containing protein [Intestinimonas butyriciproducens]|uniref:helix-turn-helix domain-containing protein n=1 Tax=Intestinimonas butyriciproducens TaxID=1297617 RepID=UPI00195DDE14|nr:helix-turn-helix transcriptional regulator [Intestinimonas butyriciproducens]MBM6976754.1 helix-turn-helix transcriptional regulator [Intestinimonas butyriciproducens]